MEFSILDHCLHITLPMHIFWLRPNSTKFQQKKRWQISLDVIAVPVDHATFQLFRKIRMIFFTFETFPSVRQVCVHCFKFLCIDKTKRPGVRVSLRLESKVGIPNKTVSNNQKCLLFFYPISYKNYQQTKESLVFDVLKINWTIQKLFPFKINILTFLMTFLKSVCQLCWWFWFEIWKKIRSLLISCKNSTLVWMLNLKFKSWKNSTCCVCLSIWEFHRKHSEP